MLRLVTQAATLVLVTRWLGPALFGEYISAATLAVVLSLLPNLGSAYVLMATEARPAGDGIDVVRYGWPLATAGGLILAAAFPLIAHLISNPALGTGDLWIIGATELLTTPVLLLLSAALQARHRVALSQLLQWIPLALRTLVALGCLLSGGVVSFRGFLLLQAGASAIGLLTIVVVANTLLDLRWSPRWPRRHEWRDGSTYAAMQLVAANPTELDKILAVRLVGAHDAGLYATASRILMAVVMPVVGVLIASQQRLFAHGAVPGESGRRLIRLLGMIAVGWGVLAAAALAVLSPLVPYAFGQQYLGTAGLVPWVALAAPFMALRITAGTVLVAIGKPAYRLAYELGGIVLLCVALAVGAQLARTHGMAIALVFSEAMMAGVGAWMVIRSHGGEQRLASH